MIRIQEQKDNNLLILEKLATPGKLWSKGAKMSYCLYHRWLRDASNTASVLGEDWTYWTAKEGKAMIKNGLFNSVNLF